MTTLDFSKMTEIEKMDLAYSSNDSNILSILARDTSSSVRRIVAKSKSATRDIVDILIHDPVMNVSFIAYQNPNSTIQREFSDTSHPCIVCTNDERVNECLNCKSLKNHYNRSHE